MKAHFSESQKGKDKLWLDAIPINHLNIREGDSSEPDRSGGQGKWPAVFLRVSVGSGGEGSRRPTGAPGAIVSKGAVQRGNGVLMNDMCK